MGSRGKQLGEAFARREWYAKCPDGEGLQAKWRVCRVNHLCVEISISMNCDTKLW